MNKVNKAVIIAAGLGTRFLPATKAVPKELFPVVSKPIVQYIVENIVSSGIKDILLIISPDKQAVRNHFIKNPALEKQLKAEQLNLVQNYKDVNIDYIYVLQRKGVADALSYAKGYVADEPFMVFLGDAVFDGEVATEMLDCYNKHNLPLMLATTVKQSEVPNYGNIQGKQIEDNVFQIENIVEKPPLELAKGNLINVGAGIYTAEIFNYIDDLKNKDGEINLMEALLNYSKQSKLLCLKTSSPFYDTGSQLGFIKANIAFGLKQENLKEGLLEYLKSIL